VAQVYGLLCIAPDDRPDRVGLESGARRCGLMAITPRSGAGISYYGETTPTTVADRHAMAMPARAE